jgi:CRP-like cAMP-binding protein
MRRCNFSAGELIFANGDEAGEMFMVFSGDVEVRRDNFSTVIGIGEIFGEAAILGGPRSMAASAKSDCVLLGFSREEIIKSFEQDPKAAIEILDAVFKKLASTTDELIRLRASIVEH